MLEFFLFFNFIAGEHLPAGDIGFNTHILSVVRAVAGQGGFISSSQSRKGGGWKIQKPCGGWSVRSIRENVLHAHYLPALRSSIFLSLLPSLTLLEREEEKFFCLFGSGGGWWGYPEAGIWRASPVLKAANRETRNRERKKKKKKREMDQNIRKKE